MPTLQSSEKESAIYREPRDPLGLASSNELCERPPTIDISRTEGSEAEFTTSHANGYSMPDFRGQGIGDLRAMAHGLDDAWMEEEFLMGFDAAWDDPTFGNQG